MYQNILAIGSGGGVNMFYFAFFNPIQLGFTMHIQSKLL